MGCVPAPNAPAAPPAASRAPQSPPAGGASPAWGAPGRPPPQRAEAPSPPPAALTLYDGLGSRRAATAPRARTRRRVETGPPACCEGLGRAGEGGTGGNGGMRSTGQETPHGASAGTLRRHRRHTGPACRAGCAGPGRGREAEGPTPCQPAAAASPSATTHMGAGPTGLADDPGSQPQTHSRARLWAACQPRMRQPPHRQPAARPNPLLMLVL